MALATLLAATPALAQRDLDREENDFRAYTDSFAADGEAKSFTFTAPANQLMTIQVLPRDGGDSVISLTEIDTDEVVAEDDDGGYSLDSRIEFMVTQQTRYRLDVSQFEGGESDSEFDVILRFSAYEPPVTQALAVGAAAEARLNARQPAYYTFTGRQGQYVDIAMTSSDESIDPVLALYRGEMVENAEIAQNDDSGDGLNSRIRTRLPADGLYTISAQDFDDAAGGYTLSLQEIEFIESGGPINLGTAEEGDLALAMDDGAPEGGNYTEYHLSDGAREDLANGTGWLIVEMTSAEMDPFLEAGFATPLGFAAAASDDDSGGELNARLLLDLNQLEAGWLESLRFRARAAAGEVGPYTMLVRHDADGSIRQEMQSDASSIGPLAK